MHLRFLHSRSSLEDGEYIMHKGYYGPQIYLRTTFYHSAGKASYAYNEPYFAIKIDIKSERGWRSPRWILKYSV